MENFKGEGEVFPVATDREVKEGPPGLPRSADVLIVGCGPVGATMANLLGRYGVKVVIIDKSVEIFAAPRAIALDNEALRILQLAGLPEDAFATVAIPYVRMCSPFFGEFARAETAGSIDGHPKLVTFYQPDLERALRARLAKYANVWTGLGVELSDIEDGAEAVNVTMRLADGQTTTLRAKYVVGADGANSLVRRLIGRDFSGNTYPEDWLIVDASKTQKPIDHIEFICDPKRPIPHMIAPGERERWEFMLHPGEKREDMERDESIRQLLAPWGRIEDMRIERKAVYRFHARTADSFHKGRVFLAGDAAHITPPFVGQGLVAGLRDAANLCWKLAWVVKQQAAPAILDTYDMERRPHAKAMIDFARFMGRLVMPRGVLAAVVLHGTVSLSRLIPRFRKYFSELEIKPKNRFSRGLFVRGRSTSKLVRGAPFPQSWVRQSGGTICLSDDALGSGFTLVGFGKDVSQHLHEETMRAWSAAGGQIVQICHRGQALHRAGHGQVWEDLADGFVPGIAPFGWAAVIRPDRVVFDDGPGASVDQMVRECLALMGKSVSAVPASR